MTLPHDLSKTTLGVSDNLIQTEAEVAVGRRIKPYRQGALDSYCGLYAITNAVLRLQPECFADNDDRVWHFFSKLMKCAIRLCAPERLIKRGLNGLELEYITRIAVRHLNRSGHRFEVLRPESIDLPIPYHFGDCAAWMAEASKESSISVILHIEERGYFHWSVLKGIDGKRVYLFDSDGMTFTYIKKCDPWIVIRSKSTDSLF